MNSQSNTEFFLLGTNVVSSDDIVEIAPSLDYLVGKGRWNFDLEDCDRVLRLRCSREEKEDVISYLKLNTLFKCEFQYLKSEMEVEEQSSYVSVSPYHLIA